MRHGRVWELAREYWFDALILGGLVWWIADAAVNVHSPGAEDGPLWFDVLAVFAIMTPLLARRRFPIGSLLAAIAAVLLTSLVDVELIKHPFVAFAFALTIAFRFGMQPKRLIGVAGLALLIATAGFVELISATGHAGDFIWDAITFSVAWVIGFAVGEKFREVDEARERAELAEREREERARRAVADERARIARELHDVVGHSVSVMTVQASAVRVRLEDDQEQVRDALEVVEQTGREALAEMRRMVGVLRQPDEEPAVAPEPSLEQIAGG
jgi:signal transduction histidine kinase